MREGHRYRFQIGDYWLGEVEGGASWYAFWWDKSSRRTRRRSLDESEHEKAKIKLAEFALKHARAKDAGPNELSIAEVLVAYLDDHAVNKASCDLATIACLHINDWWGTKKVSDITANNQREFIKHLAVKKNLAPSSIRRYLSVLSAALNRAIKCEMLTAAPQIILAETEIGDLVNAPGKIKERRLTIQELAAFLDAIRTPHVWRYTLLALNTLARPDAITDLTRSQIREERIDLNPAGRRQNKKFRPIVPVTPTLDAWLRLWKDDHSSVVHYKGEKIANPKKAIHKTAIAAGLVGAGAESSPDVAVTPYTLRRTMARLLRAEGVPLADIGAMLGHKIPGMTTTEIYADADPNYLRTVVDGIEAILDRVSAHTKTAPVRVPNIACDQAATKWPETKRIYVGQNGRSP